MRPRRLREILVQIRVVCLPRFTPHWRLTEYFPHRPDHVAYVPGPSPKHPLSQTGVVHQSRPRRAASLNCPSHGAPRADQRLSAVRL